MQITSFHVAEDHTVTLEMERMPMQANTHNTVITIGGAAQSSPEVVSAREGKIVFNAGTADQEGPITVVIGGRANATATSAEPYMTLHPDTENPDKAVIRSVSPTSAKAGEPVTVRGRCLNNLAGLQLGFNQIPSFTHTETSARFTIPMQMKAGTYPINFKDEKFSGAFESSTVRLTVTAADEG